GAASGVDMVIISLIKYTPCINSAYLNFLNFLLRISTTFTHKKKAPKFIFESTKIKWNEKHYLEVLTSDGTDRSQENKRSVSGKMICLEF
uniref:Uncharacterized protein n=1 Tax=Oryctolagus cuniculus TaxID=9986 RepID=A0A5F9DGU9_RABIT